MLDLSLKRKEYEYKGNFFINFYVQTDVYTNKGKTRYIIDSSDFLKELFTMLVVKDNISIFKFPYILYELFETSKLNVRGEFKEYELNLFRKSKYTTKLETGTDYKKMYLEILDFYANIFDLEDVLN